MPSAAPSSPAPRRPGVSFQSRITIVAMITAVAVLIAACAAFIVEQWRAEQSDHMAQQTAVTEVFAAGASVTASFRNPVDAPQNILRVKRMYPRFSAAAIVDLQGRVLARFGPPEPEALAAGQNRARAVVRLDGRPVGALVTFTEAASIWVILPRYLALTAALLFAATGLALFLGRWLAGKVTEPVERLSRVMRTVADSADFAQRVDVTADDELGRLIDSFNDLLSRLNDNDHALRRTMAELVEARDAAESANRFKSQFLANMSHEIRTPLNGLLAMTQIMAMEALNASQRERLDVIQQSGEALLAILNDVLDVSKIEAGKLELEVGDFDAAAVLQGVCAVFAPVADSKGLSFRIDVRRDAEGRRRGDAARLRQIVGNLVANALKFTPTGGVEIVVDGLGADGAEGLRIAVSDTGIGIAAEVMPRLFQKFAQADSSITRKFGGTGLGLAICQELSERMGGGIAVESRPGEGSTFVVELPLVRAAAAPAAPAEPEPAPAEGSDRVPRVLAAEDNATNQLVLTTVMGIFGVELTLVGDGRQAVEAWRANAFDLILMDIQMPEMDGLAATRTIRQVEAETGRARTPIIALSAHAMAHQVAEHLAMGVDLHVPKPIELAKLKAAMDDAMALGAEAIGAQTAA